MLKQVLQAVRKVAERRYHFLQVKQNWNHISAPLTAREQTARSSSVNSSLTADICVFQTLVAVYSERALPSIRLFDG
ncbi:hypothetical protein J6590_018967 [Homalodisca vitripennis]|nr:hypothetical protein J6590_018967 [Homalodisca vitripennis]